MYYDRQEELERFEKSQADFTFESVLSDTKSSLNTYFSSDEYRKKLENEIKIEKYWWNDLELTNFEEKIWWIVLDATDNKRVSEIITDRLQKLEAIDIVPVTQIAFYEWWDFSPDLEWSLSGFYYASEIVWWKHYMGVKKNKSDKNFSFPEFGKVYILNLFALGPGFWTQEEKQQYMATTLFHELWWHAVMDYNKGFTKWSERIYRMMTKKWVQDPELKEYFGDKSEIQSRMMEFRHILYLLGQITTISESITESHVNTLITHYQKIHDDISVKLLKKYKALELKNIMNWITMNDQLDDLSIKVW